MQELMIGGRPGNAAYSYSLLGPDLDELRRWTETMVEKLRTVPGINDVSSDQERTGLINRLVIDRDAAARLGVSIDDISNVFNNSFSQRQVSTIYGARNQYKVVLEIDPALQQDDAVRPHLRAFRRRHAWCRLKALARVERDVAPLRVTHLGQYPATTISFNLPPTWRSAPCRTCCSRRSWRPGCRIPSAAGMAATPRPSSPSRATSPC
jgi:multidrug efflux pump subunit AcrB